MPAPKVLMVFPRFNPNSFWSMQAACDVWGVKCPAPPLGMITVAALLPREWSIKLVNRNAEELKMEDIDWADMVMTGGMLPQQKDTLLLIERCQARGKPVVIGGPDPTSSPDVYAHADFLVLGEAEGIIQEFAEAWDAGERRGRYEAEKFQVDVTRSPIPRFDLLNFKHYLHVGVQFSRGCPFNCEFCDIIELYGRVPRSKTNAQMLAELQTLYTLPKLIGALTPGGKIPTSLPAEVETFLSSRVAEPGTRVSGSAERFVERRTASQTLGVIQNESSMSRWRLPLVGALAALAIGALLYNREPAAPVTAQAPTALPAIVENVKTAAATATESVQRGASLALTEQDARAWIDRPVYSSDGQKLGEVAAFLRTSDNKVSELQADIGGFLGIGEHRIRLAPAQFSLHSDRVVLDLTAAQLKELPKIQK